MRREIAGLYRKLLDLARNDVDSRRSMTVPGIGPITALAFHSAIDDPASFRRSRSVGAYVGLTPRRYASGEVDWSGRISKCGDTMVRSYLFEAAGVLLTRMPQWCKLKAWGYRLWNASASRRPRSRWHGSWRSSSIACGAMEPTSTGQARRRRLRGTNPPIIPRERNRCPCRDGGVGEIDRGFAMPHRGKRVFNIVGSASSNAIMQRAQPLLRREQ